MTRTTSDFGKELDSLADVITFGVAPALLAYVWGFRMLPVTVMPMVRQRLVPLGVCGLLSVSDLRGIAGWRGSISASIRSQRTRGGRGGSTLSACRFRRVRV